MICNIVKGGREMQLKKAKKNIYIYTYIYYGDTHVLLVLQGLSE
jgi:hypothetical protein